jgi:UPF0042 nucleotide-binding protein
MSVSVVIITGLSGSGMSSALKAFEDLGYFAVDNLPVQLIPTFVRLCAQSVEIDRTAFVVDVRSREFIAEFSPVLNELTARDVTVTVLFLEADDDLLVRRYSETRRPHPLPDQDVRAAIRHERQLLGEIRDLADVIIDTSEHTVHTLRDVIKDRFAEKGGAHNMSVNIVSFGFRHGLPREVDMLFDVRYLRSESEVEEAIGRFTEMLAYLLPRFQREGKSYLTIGVGCTGGRHRSVMISEALHDRLAERGFRTSVVHRDIGKDSERYKQ